MIWAIASIILLFIIIVALQKHFKIPCALCGAIALTWLALLILFWMGIWEDPLVIALLMGASITGVLYLLEKRVEKDLLVFRAPFVLTMVVMALLLLGQFNMAAIVLLLAAWVVFILIYLQNRANVVTRLIECCRRW